MSQTIKTDMQSERDYFSKVTEVVAKTGERLKADIKKAEADIKAMTIQYDEGEYDVASIILNTIDMKKMTEAALKRTQKIGDKPYFGRIIFDNESLYIGRNAIHGDNITDQLVVDWRAPVSNAYYENGLGEMHFRTPLGEEITVNLKMKRTFDIDNGKLTGYFDSENTANDELLNKYLARNKQAVLGEIIATIQKEQNDIIRMSPRHNVLVQGAAGSGKTTVAMHRISYILYNYADTVKPQDFYIIGSNKMLLNYITGVLPDLDVTGFRQMTMEEMFTRLMYEEWDPFLYRIKDSGSSVNADIKGSSAFFERLKGFLDGYERKHIKQEDVILDPNMFVEGIENGKTGIYDRRDNPSERKGAAVCLLRGSAIKRYIDDNPQLSMQNKINALNKELFENLENEFAGKVSYTEKEKKAIKSYFNGYIGDKECRESVYEIYDEFVQNEDDPQIPSPTRKLVRMLVTGEGTKHNLKVRERDYSSDIINDWGTGRNAANDDEGLNFAVKNALANAAEKPEGEIRENPERKRNPEEGLYRAYDAAAEAMPERYIRKYVTEYDIYELAALAYIYRRIKETRVISEAHHIVIDEAQDYGIMAYRVLRECVRECTYTIMGDVSQNIRYDSGINDWSELRKYYLDNPQDRFMLLRKSYRNTIEISEFATQILDHGDFEVYPSEPIIRHGEKPQVVKTDAESLVDEIADRCRKWQEEGLLTIAVVCRNEKEQKQLREMLDGKIELINTDGDCMEFGNGIMVLPVTMTKGLEFDAVLICNPTKRDYPADNRHAKFLYVAATRALHRLTVLYTNSLTELIAKPVDKSRTRHVINPEGESGPTREETEQFEEKKRRLLEEDEQNSKQKMLDEAMKRTQQYLNSRKGASKANVHALNGNNETEVKTAAGEAKTVPAEKRTAICPAVNNSVSVFPDFIRPVSPDEIRPSGHTAASMAVKWIQKKNDGIYFQSLSGITRLQPVADNIIRVSYCAGMNFKTAPGDICRSYKMSRDFKYKETAQSVEIMMKKMTVKFDRYRGSCIFCDASGREFLSEDSKEPKYTDTGRNKTATYTFFKSAAGESWHVVTGMVSGENVTQEDILCNMKFVKNAAYYISPGNNKIPCIIKKDRYALIPLTVSKTAFCSMPVLGNFILQEDAFSDYYVVLSDSTDKLAKAYLNLQ